MDCKYWNEYYRENPTSIDPTDFAKSIIKYLNPGKKLLELGCGNGRDSIYFHNNRLDVTAIDQSDVIIAKLTREYKNIKFFSDDFITTELLEKKFNYIYSRFTLHSITEYEEDILLKRVYFSLEKDGLFLLEARSVKDAIYGLGENIDKNVFIYNNHTRRFIEIEELISKMRKIGFDIKLKIEDKNLAIYNDENPVVIRIIGKK